MILKDKVVIITGAGPGMGQAMCRGAAAEGAKVVISARSVPAIEEIAHDIVSKGGEAIACPMQLVEGRRDLVVLPGRFESDIICVDGISRGLACNECLLKHW